MVKNNFLLVDLSDDKVKKLAETITSPTSRKILDHLAEKEDTEANMAKVLGSPISTVHYHLQKLVEAKLVVVVDEFHYSPKGREVNHYKLANKYIIIAPKKVSGLRDKLKGILPVALIILGIGAVIKFLGSMTTRSSFSSGMKKAVMEEAALDIAAPAMAEKAVNVVQTTPQVDMALWFLIGGFATLLIYLLMMLAYEKLRKK